MHQTVREFFLYSDGSAAKSKFSMSHEDAHSRISIACLRYLILCVTSTTLENELPSVDSWTAEHFETYTQHLNDKPFINYALSYLTQHINVCKQDANISRFVSQLDEILTRDLPLVLLGRWVGYNLSGTLPDRGAAENFKTQILHTATRMGFSRVVEAVLIVGAQVEARLQDKTPLIISAQRGDNVTVRLLIDWDADKEAKGSDGRTALHVAALNRQDSTVQLFVKTLGADMEAGDRGGRTALHVAALNGHDSTVQLLVKTLGADMKAKDSKWRKALHLAVAQGHESTIRLLVTFGANTEAEDLVRRTALHYAAAYGHESIVQLLINEFRANKEGEDNWKYTALHYAAMFGHDSTVRLLINTLHVNMEATDLGGNTALDLARKL
jgi:ankyrin repeat protein